MWEVKRRRGARPFLRVVAWVGERCEFVRAAVVVVAAERDPRNETGLQGLLPQRLDVADVLHRAHWGEKHPRALLGAALHALALGTTLRQEESPSLAGRARRDHRRALGAALGEGGRMQLFSGHRSGPWRAGSAGQARCHRRPGRGLDGADGVVRGPRRGSWGAQSQDAGRRHDDGCPIAVGRLGPPGRCVCRREPRGRPGGIRHRHDRNARGSAHGRRRRRRPARAAAGLRADRD